MINRTAVTELDGRIRRPMLPALVRLAFHDCNSPAGCDGCVNLDIAENNGLNASVSNLEGLYKNTSLGISTAMSRADFWALAGLTAANYGARLQKVWAGQELTRGGLRQSGDAANRQHQLTYCPWPCFVCPS